MIRFLFKWVFIPGVVIIAGLFLLARMAPGQTYMGTDHGPLRQVTPIGAVDRENAVIQDGKVTGFTLTPGQLVTGNIGGCTNGVLGTTPYAFRLEQDGRFTETRSGVTFPAGTTRLTVKGCLERLFVVVTVAPGDGNSVTVTKLDEPEQQ